MPYEVGLVTIEGSWELNTAVGAEPTDVEDDDEASFNKRSWSWLRSSPLRSARVKGSPLRAIMSATEGADSMFKVSVAKQRSSQKVTGINMNRVSYPMPDWPSTRSQFTSVRLATSDAHVDR